MAYIILAGKGKILVRKSVRAISDEEMAQVLAKERIAKLDETANTTYGHEWPTEPGVRG
jgi:hypothetical protein